MTFKTGDTVRPHPSHQQQRRCAAVHEEITASRESARNDTFRRGVSLSLRSLLADAGSRECSGSITCGRLLSPDAGNAEGVLHEHSSCHVPTDFSSAASLRSGRTGAGHFGEHLNFHYGKHHKTYVETLNKLIVGTEFADMPLEKIIKATSGQADHTAIFNNAAQAWNHSFYWKSLKPKGGGEPPAALKR